MISTRARSTPIVNWIVKSNIMIFFLWYLFLFVDPQFMIKNFLVSWTGILEGRVWTIVTSIFSHNLFFHIFLNMYFFYGFGRVLELTMGSMPFLKFYLLSGISGSLGHCLTSVFILDRPELSALGASGAISGVLVYFGLKYPKEKVYLLGLIPLPALVAIFTFVGLDLWGLISQGQGSSELPIGHGAHLGGALFGIIYYLYIRLSKKN